MSSTWELKEKSRGELKTTVEGDTWKSAQKKALKNLSKKVNLPGFRPGQAPEVLIKKHISAQNVLLEAVDEVAPEALSAGIEDHDLFVIDRPTLDVESIDEEKVTFVFNVTVKPEVTLGAYKGLEFTKEEVIVSDADVDAEIERLQERFADLIVKEEGKVENGDTAIIDFEGFKEGVAFEGGKGENYPLVIGSSSFIPGFEEQVLGMGIEETKDINVTFPEEYQVEDLAGQPVVFKVTVHEIKAKELPQIDDELIKQAEIDDIETVEEFKIYTRENLESSKNSQAEQKFESELLTAIADNATVDIPNVMIEKETDSMVKEFERRLQSQGVTIDQFKEATGQSDEQIREEIGKDAFTKVKIGLILEAIAAEEKIEVSQDEITTELRVLANHYCTPVERVQELLTNDAIAYDLRIRKALEFVKESVDK